MEFFSNACAPNNRTTLEYERLQTSFGEIKSRNQAIVPAADNDDVVTH
jgi:hypothetical protein